MALGLVLVHEATRRRAKVTVIQACLVIAGITLILLGFSGQLYRLYHGAALVPTATIAMFVAVLMLVLGILVAMISAAAQTLLQESTSDNNRGRVFSALNMMVNIAASWHFNRSSAKAASLRQTPTGPQ
jgi:sugar phosphate permease